jgi:hypothetical protein
MATLEVKAVEHLLGTGIPSEAEMPVPARKQRSMITEMPAPEMTLIADFWISTV